MLKRYCDVCGKEVGDDVYNRLQGTKGRVTVEIMVALDGVWNKGEVCRQCVLEACLVVERSDVRRQ